MTTELERLQLQLSQWETLQQDYKTLQAKQAEITAELNRDRHRLQRQKTLEQQLQQAQQQVDWQQQQLVTLKGTLQQTETQWRQHNRLRQDLREILDRSAEIEAGDRLYQQVSQDFEGLPTPLSTATGATATPAGFK